MKLVGILNLGETNPPAEYHLKAEEDDVDKETDGKKPCLLISSS